VEVWQISNLRPLRLGEEKKKRMKIYMVSLLHRATINKRSKNFDERPHRMRDFSSGKFTVILGRPIATLVDSIRGNSDVRDTGNGARTAACGKIPV